MKWTFQILPGCALSLLALAAPPAAHPADIPKGAGSNATGTAAESGKENGSVGVLPAENGRAQSGTQAAVGRGGASVEAPVKSREKEGETQAAALAVLQQRVEAIDWEDAPLHEILDWLREQGPINVIAVWRELNDIGIDRNSPVTLKMRDSTVEQVLAEMLEQLSPDGEIGFRAYGNTIKLSSRRHFDQQLYTRVYNVADVIFNVEEFAPAIDFAYTSPFGCFGLDTYVLPEMRQEELANALRDILGPDMDPERCAKCSMVIYGQSLIIRAPLEIHERLAGRQRLVD